MAVYGVWMAALCLLSFVLVLYGFGDGPRDIGRNCNDTFSDQCEVVFRARATTFACMTWFALFLAWEVLDLRRSFFRRGWAARVWRNRFLFWSVVAGFVTIFPILYIPGLNTNVFRHSGISWEWGVVFVETLVFVLGIEAWKWAKRVYFRRRARRTTTTSQDEDLETRAFGRYFSTDEKTIWDEEAASKHDGFGGDGGGSPSTCNKQAEAEKGAGY